MRTSGGMRRFVLMGLLLFVLSVLTGGCSRQGTVSGTITFRGQPVKGGTVTFFPEGQSNAHTAIIGTDGTYTISKLPPGPAKITVAVGTTGVPANVLRSMGDKRAEKGLKQMGRIGRGASGVEAKEKENIAEAPTVPQKYAKPEESGLSITVTGGNQKHDIKLDG